jgi:transposase InsO family protein
MGYTEGASCRVVGLERSTYYDNEHRVASNRAIRRLLLRDVKCEVRANSRGTYGRLRVTATLRFEHGLIVNQKLVARIMRDLEVHGLPKRKRDTRNLVNVANYDDLVNRNFVADRPDVLWPTDITEHLTREGTVYCCCALDIYSRKVVGRAIDLRCELILVNDVLSMAARTRFTSPSTVIHSDHWSQLTSWAFS